MVLMDEKKKKKKEREIYIKKETRVEKKNQVQWNLIAVVDGSRPSND